MGAVSLTRAEGMRQSSQSEVAALPTTRVIYNTIRKGRDQGHGFREGCVEVVLGTCGSETENSQQLSEHKEKILEI